MTSILHAKRFRTVFFKVEEIKKVKFFIFLIQIYYFLVILYLSIIIFNDRLYIYNTVHINKKYIAVPIMQTQWRY